VRDALVVDLGRVGVDLEASYQQVAVADRHGPGDQPLVRRPEKPDDLVAEDPFIGQRLDMQAQALRTKRIWHLSRYESLLFVDSPVMPGSISLNCLLELSRAVNGSGLELQLAESIVGRSVFLTAQTHDGRVRRDQQNVNGSPTC
jgi:hypothetical protein